MEGLLIKMAFVLLSIISSIATVSHSQSLSGCVEGRSVEGGNGEKININKDEIDYEYDNQMATVNV